MSGIKARVYTIGLCYLCQECLHCNKNCSTKKCKCKKKTKPPEIKKGVSRKYYACTFNPSNLNKKPYNSWQLNELTCKSEYYGYNINFSEEFNFSLCPKCHSKLNRLGKKKNKAQEDSIEFRDIEHTSLPETQPINISAVEDTTPTADAAPTVNAMLIADEILIADKILIADATPTADMAPIINTTSTADTNTSQNHAPPNESLQNNLDSSTSESPLLELKFKLIIKFSDRKSYPAKWERIVVEDFYSFKDNLEFSVQSQLEDQVVFQNDYITSYKYEKEGRLGTQLINKRTQPSNIIYQIDDDEEIDNKKKKKSNCDDKKKKTKTPSNQIPKENSLNEADAQIAKTVMELHSRWYCNEHDRSCYVDLTRHITLTTNHLSTWAKSIDHNLASLEEPPTLPLFDAAYSVKRTNNNLQHSNIQTSNSFYLSTTTSSSFIAMPFPVYYLGMFN
ncbi:unnamed protein product [Rhizophagus irregularis]|nr:unnamed protein product [Rhizophagus irregularis]